MNYKLTTQNPVEAYSFCLLCEPPFDDDEDEEGDEEGEGNGSCDGGKKCLCSKPVTEHPDHPWKVSVAGKTKFFLQRVHGALRTPDSFGMYTFNDHSAYGTLEIIQNLFLDFQNAADNVKEQWAVCEALGLFMASGEGMEMTMIDDGDLCEETVLLIGRLFLAMLARLERENLLSNDSEILNIGLVMALYMMIPGLLGFTIESKPKEALGPKKDGMNWCPDEFTDHIVAYARKYEIKLVGPKDIDELVDNAASEADLPVPASNAGAKADPFSFGKTMKAYCSKHKGVTQFLSKRSKAGKTPIGGDALDITTWTSAERKMFAFNKKDPLSAREIAAIKAGDVMTPG